MFWLSLDLPFRAPSLLLLKYGGFLLTLEILVAIYGCRMVQLNKNFKLWNLIQKMHHLGIGVSVGVQCKKVNGWTQNFSRYEKIFGITCGFGTY